jgi:hypothetical protein
VKAKGCGAYVEGRGLAVVARRALGWGRAAEEDGERVVVKVCDLRVHRDDVADDSSMSFALIRRR